MAAGGLIAGLIIALAAGLIARASAIKEDAALAGFLLVSLALGVVIISRGGTEVDLLDVLFGSAQSIGNPALILMLSIATLSLIVLALIWRPLVLECADPGFLRSVSRSGGVVHVAFLALLVLNLVGGFIALGTLLAVGILILPAVIARFWARDITRMVGIAVIAAMLSGYAGLLASHHADLPAGPAVILTAGVLYVLSVLVGPVGGLIWLVVPRRHLQA
jgi:zinc/manganese transport system permease protein